MQGKDAYEHVVEVNPGHGKVLQQLGWLYHQDGSSFQNQELAINTSQKASKPVSSLAVDTSSVVMVLIVLWNF